MIERSKSSDQIDQLRKHIINIFIRRCVYIWHQDDLQIKDFLDLTFNLNNGTYKPYEKPNDTLLYINRESNHRPHILKELTDYVEIFQKETSFIHWKAKIKT